MTSNQQIAERIVEAYLAPNTHQGRCLIRIIKAELDEKDSDHRFEMMGEDL